MKKLVKLTSDHYIIVDDSEIKEKSGDLFYSFETGKVYDTLIHHTTVSCKKITHSTQPLEQGYGCEIKEGLMLRNVGKELCYDLIEPLSLSEVKELLGEVDVEKKSYAFIKKVEGSEEHRLTYIDGYNQALEDNKDRKYTEKDMRRAYYKGAVDCHDKCTERNWRGIELKVRVDSLIDLCSTYIQLPTSWDVTFVDGKFKLV